MYWVDVSDDELGRAQLRSAAPIAAESTAGRALALPAELCSGVRASRSHSAPSSAVQGEGKALEINRSAQRPDGAAPGGAIC